MASRSCGRTITEVSSGRWSRALQGTWCFCTARTAMASLLWLQGTNVKGFWTCRSCSEADRQRCKMGAGAALGGAPSACALRSWAWAEPGVNVRHPGGQWAGDFGCCRLFIQGMLA